MTSYFYLPSQDRSDDPFILIENIPYHIKEWNLNEDIKFDHKYYVPSNFFRIIQKRLFVKPGFSFDVIPMTDTESYIVATSFTSLVISKDIPIFEINLHNNQDDDEPVSIGYYETEVKRFFKDKGLDYQKFKFHDDVGDIKGPTEARIVIQIEESNPVIFISYTLWITEINAHLSHRFSGYMVTTTTKPHIKETSWIPPVPKKKTKWLKRTMR